MPIESIAVTGMGAITALGLGVNSLWSGLMGGRRPFAPVRAFDTGACRVNIAAEVSAKVASLGTTRTVDLGVVAAQEALGDAELRVPIDRIGLVVGSTGVGDEALKIALSGKTSNVDWWKLCQKQSLADELAAILGLGGYRQVINTACSSGAIAIALACDGLRSNDYDAVVALGCDELASFTYSGFHALRALDSEPCKPFDRNRRGMTMGEGAGCLVLERLADARSHSKRIHAVIAGAGLACDAHHLTAPDPEGRGAALALMRALEQAEILPRAVGFINAHGTGTPLNDSAEVAGIEKALGEYAASWPVHSVKASTGHCMGAAGTIETIVTILSLQTGVIPATAGLIDCEFNGRVDCVRGKPRPFRARYGISNSFGFGGNNAALVLALAETYPGQIG